MRDSGFFDRLNQGRKFPALIFCAIADFRWKPWVFFYAGQFSHGASFWGYHDLIIKKTPANFYLGLDKAG
jgi:hypothetical protein